MDRGIQLDSLSFSSVCSSLSPISYHPINNIMHKHISLVGTMGPGSAQPKSAKEIRPKSQPTKECPGDLPSGYPKETRPKSQPTQERPANPLPGCPGTSYPGCLFTQVFPFPVGNPIKQSCQPALHDISKISHEPVVEDQNIHISFMTLLPKDYCLIPGNGAIKLVEDQNIHISL